MRTWNWHRRFILLAGLALLNACASESPTLFTLGAVPGETHSSGPRVVVLREIGLARYLQRSQIVRSSENYQIDVSANDWWGEPLGPMLSRVLVEELSQRLPGTTVLAEAGAISASPDVSVEVNIQRLDADRTGAVILRAQVALSYATPRRGLTARSIAISVPQESHDVRGEVSAMSNALGQLSDQIANMIASR